MQLDDLDFADDLSLPSHTQQQIQEKTDVAAASAAVGLNIHKKKSKSSISTTEEHLEIKTTANQHQGQNSIYKCQDSSLVWGGNLQNYERHHPENTGDYQQLSTQNTSDPLTRQLSAATYCRRE
ncbi:unnamed protein product [Schistosoma curassoni]|uniref:Uncharacterized protein n=1 Tax=Schistosoma curassoni TaxID=6186 RepID=A0A183K0V7_9TREM|nr:unnamed protein product [Schistosoma curassoni]